MILNIFSLNLQLHAHAHARRVRFLWPRIKSVLYQDIDLYNESSEVSRLCFKSNIWTTLPLGSTFYLFDTPFAAYAVQKTKLIMYLAEVKRTLFLI